MKRNSGKTAIVTGASSGIGRASAEALAKAGFTVFGTSRRTTSKGPSGVIMLTGDVTDDASVAAVVKSVIDETGRIDLLVNNAGSGLSGGAEEFSTEEAKALFDVNVFGIARMTRAVLPTMRAQGQGRIVNISSVLGLVPTPYMALYSATKFAVEGYSESLDHEVREFGIRVVLVEPGFTNTSFEQNRTLPDQPMPLYDRARAKVDAYFRKLAATGDSAELVADVVLKAAQDRSPKTRYLAGKNAHQLNMLRRLMPAQLFDMSLRKEMSLPV
ncbi:3-oxoacyl-[acyl-carrier-protein] reductase FabG [Terricaulis silvestris]|uniref:D-xylose 1-dehydrogenase n=2 Tax=Terricaulis silvestris TaxID=2686094 RepID=A0A6I6MRS9_9CAUL|nr:3-oxoacyl-[acyl-carrier-protein] reductase FabG [Terricaulis silvestris]